MSITQHSKICQNKSKKHLSTKKIGWKKASHALEMIKKCDGRFTLSHSEKKMEPINVNKNLNKLLSHPNNLLNFLIRKKKTLHRKVDASIFSVNIKK